MVNKAVAAKANRKWNLKSRYGITLEEYDDLLARQDGKCAICRTPADQFERPLAVDHDHSCCPERARSCGRCVRGLLCARCNPGIGYFQDDIDLLRKAVEYLENVTGGV